MRGESGSAFAEQQAPVHNQLDGGDGGIVGADRGEKPPAVDGRGVCIRRGRNQRRRFNECGGVEELARRAECDVGARSSERPDGQPLALDR